jgi:hypothetical protein
VSYKDGFFKSIKKGCIVDSIWLVLIIPLVLLGVAAAAVFVYLALPLPFPASTESDYSYHTTPWWQIYYCHKYLRPKRRAEKGSGLEEYFRSQDFHFDTSALKNKKIMTISATGDLMCRKDMDGPGGAFVFEETGLDIFSSDLCIGNMEFAVNPKMYFHKLLRFSVPHSYATPLLQDAEHGKFDAVSLANNHINDSFHEGIVETCNFLDAKGIAHTGANRTPQDQDKILMLERIGIKIAVLSYTFSTNGIPLEKGCEFGTNVIRFNALKEEDYRPELILKHIALAKQQGADYIISCHHWGIDLETYPPQRMVERTHALLDAGIDLIIGHHPHVLGPAERYRTKDGRDALVFYSLGNFTAKGLPFPIQRLAAIARLTLLAAEDENGRKVIVPEELEMIPTLFTFKKADGVKRGIVRKVKPWATRIAADDRLEALSRREILELSCADKAFKKYFELEKSGIRYR